MSEATTTLPGPTARTMPLPARRALLVPVLLFGLLALLPLAVALGLPSHWLTLVTRAMIFAIAALSLDLILGVGGLVSFGHAAYFGMASYVCAYTAKNWGLTPELAILLGTAVSGGLGLVFGALAIRRQGIYFAMITLALAQMVFFFSLQTPRFTGGEDGIQAVPRGHLFGLISLADDRTLYWLVAAIFMAGLLAIYRIIHSPFGQVCKAIRDNEPSAISLGYRANQYKLAVFVLSASLAGLAGSTKAIVFQLASLTDVHWSMSGEVVLMTLLGGLGTILGPGVGAAVIVALENGLADKVGSWVTVIMGGIFVVEALSVMLQVTWFKYTKKKYGEGRRILKMAPLHHHFEKSGWKETQVVVRFWIITMLLCLIGLSTLKLR